VLNGRTLGIFFYCKILLVSKKDDFLKFADVFKKIYKEKGFTLATLKEALHNRFGIELSLSALKSYNQGKLPKYETLEAFAELFKVPIDIFFPSMKKLPLKASQKEEIIFEALQNPTSKIKKMIENYNHSHGFIRGDIIGDGSNNGHTINNNHSDKTLDPLTDKLVGVFNSVDEETRERIFFDVLKYKYS